MKWITQQLTTKRVEKGLEPITTIIHAGDVFDYHQVTVNTLCEVRDLFAGFEVYAVKGNHEDTSYLHKKGISAIDLVGFDHPYDTPGKAKVGKTNFVFSPWGYEIDLSLLEKDCKNVLVAHGYPRQYVPTSKDGRGEKREKNEGGVLSTKSEEFDLVITGHYHIADEFKIRGTRYLNPGSMSAFADAKGHKPSYWILDTDTLEYERCFIDESVTTLIHEVETSDPDKSLGEIISSGSEHIYRVKSDRLPDKKLLLEAGKSALVLQLKLDNKIPANKKVEADIGDFWKYVKKRKPEYEEDFKSRLEKAV
jgi:predicted phosphodiesterase